MLKLFYFFKGYLFIRVSGVSAERFMNLCGIRHMMLWNIKQDGDSYTMCISLKSFFGIRDIVRKTSTRVAVLKRIGLPFLLPGIKKRWFFPVFLFFALTVFILSQFLIWDVKVKGNQEIEKEGILVFLEEYGVKEGILKKQLDTGLLEKELRKKYPEITWVSVYLDGNSLVVHLKENDKPIPEEEDTAEKPHKEGFLEEETGMDICAVKEGKVISMVTRTGTPLVAPGDSVSVGDVLIRGIVEINDNEGNVRETVNVHADGDVIIESIIRTKLQTPAVKTVTEETGRSRKYTYVRWGDRYRVIQLFKIPYQDYQAIPHAYMQTDERLGIVLELGEMEIKEEIKRETEKTKEEYEAELSKMLEEYIATLSEKAIQIKGKNVKIKKNADSVILTGTLKAQGPFFEGKETEIEEVLPEVTDE